MAGATPKDTMSERLSYSLPNALAVLVHRATRPSKQVEKHGDEHRDAGVFESQVDGRHDGIKAGEQRAGGEKIREPINSARPCW